MVDMCVTLYTVIASENPYGGRELAAAENVEGSLAKACAQENARVSCNCSTNIIFLC